MKQSSNIARGLIMVILLLMAYYDTKVTFHPKDASLDKMSLGVESSLLAHSSYRLIWFEIEGRRLLVRYNSLLGPRKLRCYAITPAAKTVGLALAPDQKAFKLSGKEHAGTFAAVMPRFKKDVNADGALENIELSAKIDTLFTQVKTALLDPGIPFEVVKGTDGITVFFKQKPLINQAVRLIYQRGADKVVTTDAKGMIAIPDIRDLRQGITVVYQTPGPTCYITSYVQEAYSVFSKRHGIALLPLVKILLCAGGLAGIFLWGSRALASFHATKYAKKGRLYLVKSVTK